MDILAGGEQLQERGYINLRSAVLEYNQLEVLTGLIYCNNCWD